MSANVSRMEHVWRVKPCLMGLPAIISTTLIPLRLLIPFLKLNLAFKEKKLSTLQAPHSIHPESMKTGLQSFKRNSLILFLYFSLISFSHTSQTRFAVVWDGAIRAIDSGFYNIYFKGDSFRFWVAGILIGDYWTLPVLDILFFFSLSLFFFFEKNSLLCFTFRAMNLHLCVENRMEQLKRLMRPFILIRQCSIRFALNTTNTQGTKWLFWGFYWF